MEKRTEMSLAFTPAPNDLDVEVDQLKLQLFSKLASGVAHDMNNLLTVIGGFTELALGVAAEDPALKGNLDCVKEACLQASALNARLLAYSGGFLGSVRSWRIGDLAEAFRKPMARLLGEKVPCLIELSGREAEVRVSEAGLHCLIFGSASQAIRSLESLERAEIHLCGSSGAPADSGLQVRLRLRGKRRSGGDIDPIPICRALAHDLGFTFSQEITDQPGVAYDFRFDVQLR